MLRAPRHAASTLLVLAVHQHHLRAGALGFLQGFRPKRRVMPPVTWGMLAVPPFTSTTCAVCDISRYRFRGRTCRQIPGTT